MSSLYKQIIFWFIKIFAGNCSNLVLIVNSYYSRESFFLYKFKYWKKIMVISVYLTNLSKLVNHNNKQIHLFRFLNFLKEIFSPQKIKIYDWNWRIKIHSLRKESIFRNNYKKFLCLCLWPKFAAIVYMTLKTATSWTETWSWWARQSLYWIHHYSSYLAYVVM